ncbi:hypothetical protein BG005_009353 [Podila minutissima]|nr:hypothetical protein BG005_009353 [Podila minutissima]
MQSDSFKRFSKDWQRALGIPSGFFRKSKKVGNKDISHNTSQAASRSKSMASSDCSVGVKIDKANSPRAHNTIDEFLSVADIGKTVKIDDQFLASPRTRGPDSGHGVSPEGGGLVSGTTNLIYSSAGSPISPGEFTKGISPKIATSLIHLPPSINELDRMSPQRQAWVRSFLDTTTSTQRSDIVRSESAWDVMDVSPSKGHDRTTSSGQGVPNTFESTGLFIVKMIQVTNKASNKIFDVEWNLRIGNVDRISHPARSFKDNPGNTVTMNEVFMFDVDEPFQLDMSLTGHPVATKFGTLAGFSNAQQAVHLGQLQLSFCLETMDRSIRTYKLLPSSDTDDKSTAKSDCEVVIMVGLHVLEEPVEDLSWETAACYRGFLTFMTRGARMSNWKRYWAVLEGRAIKLYDAEYQQKRDVLAIIPLAHLSGMHPPDPEKVDVGANGFSLAISPQGVDKSTSGEHSDVFANMDYCLYGFTDSLQMHDEWTAHLQESLEAFRAHMAQRLKARQRRLSRRALQSLSRHSFESSVPPSPLDGCEEGGDPLADLVELKFVW